MFFKTIVMKSFVILLLPLLLLSSFPLFSFSSSTPRTPLFPKEALPAKSGYLPISNNSSSFLYFAFYEAQHPITPPSRTPLLVWLQGGPGCSSMIGNFFELGPWLLTDQQTLKPNPATWNRRFGLLFIDSPIATGFSILAKVEDAPTNQTAVAKHLHSALQNFLSLDSSFRSRPLYIAGESYAGKYIPSAGYYILQQNNRLRQQEQINLQGIAIGNGLTHPLAQVKTYASSAYFTGLINEKQRAYLEGLQDELVKLIMEKKWYDAFESWSYVINQLENETRLATAYDLRRKKPYEYENLIPLMETTEAMEALGAQKGLVWNSCMDYSPLFEDTMKSVKFLVEEILRTGRLKVLLYQGMFDLVVSVASTEAWVKELAWEEGLQRFLTAERKVWEVREEMAGYVQRGGKLSNVVVSGAGHMVPADQGVNSQAMIEDWVQENGLFRN